MKEEAFKRSHKALWKTIVLILFGLGLVLVLLVLNSFLRNLLVLNLIVLCMRTFIFRVMCITLKRSVGQNSKIDKVWILAFSV